MGQVEMGGQYLADFLFVKMDYSMNRMNDLSLVIIGTIVGIAALIGIGSRFFLAKDNPIEEKMEEIIEAETGVKVDLSP